MKYFEMFSQADLADRYRERFQQSRTLCNEFMGDHGWL